MNTSTRSTALVLATLAFAALAAFPLLAQTDADDGRRVVYLAGVVEVGSDPGFADPGLARAIAASLAAELERADFATLLPRPGEGPDPLDYAACELAALGAGADVLLVGHYAVKNRGGVARLVIGARAYDLISGRPAAGVLMEGEGGIAVYDTVDEIAAGVGARMRESLPPLTPAEIVVRTEKLTVVRTEVAVEKGVPVTLVIRCPLEGARVMAGPTELGVIADGKLEVPLKAGSFLDFTIEADGFFPATHSVKVEDKDLEYAADWPFKRQAFVWGLGAGVILSNVDLGMNFLSSLWTLDAFADFYLLDEWVFAGIDGSLMWAMPDGDGTSNGTILAARPKLGAYLFFDGDTIIRFGAFAEAPFVLMLRPAAALGIGAGLGLRFELNLPLSTLMLQFRVDAVSMPLGSEIVAVVELLAAIAWK